MKALVDLVMRNHNKSDMVSAVLLWISCVWRDRTGNGVSCS